MNFVSKVTNYAERVKYVEGDRGISSRFSVFFRNGSIFLLVIIISSTIQYLTNSFPHAHNGGIFALFSISVIYITGALSTIFYANLRKEIVERARHYSLGIILFPGLLVAMVMKVSQSWLGSDTLGNTLGLALPVVFLATVIIPAFVFVKEMTGIRTLYRTKLDDQEQVSLWTRNDGLQR